MKLEDKFFNSFFYPFLISVLLSILIVTIILALFTNNNYSKKTINNIVDLGKKKSKITIKAASIILTTAFQKIQASLNEQILAYQKTANDLLKLNKNLELNTTFIKSILNIDLFYCFLEPEDEDYSAIWTLDNVTSEDNINSQKEAKYQLIAFSKILTNIDSNVKATMPEIYWYSFYFERNELYIAFPIRSLCETFQFFNLYSASYRFSSRQCVDENGEYYNVYKFKCEIYFQNFIKSKSNLFDNNYSPERNKTIFISNYYATLTDLGAKKFSMCIEFDDPISKGKAYSCSQVHDDDLIFSLENLNIKIQGYFFVSIVGYNNVFFFPGGPTDPKTITDYIYNWKLDYNLDEKSYFYDETKKIFSSNYIDYMNNSIDGEIYINGKNSSGQYFFIKGEIHNYSIFPVILENLYGEKEHVFSIIYVYNDQLFTEEVKKYNSSNIAIKIFLEIFIFILLGIGLLYIVYLTFNILVKYIVIPIKNVNYMLKGIHIGGKERLEYLISLKKRQEENIEKLGNIFINENNININEKLGNNFEDSIEKEYLDDININTNNKLIKKKSIKERVYKFSDFNKKFDKESDYIENEYKFYDFDEQLLLYRPSEIENLVESLLNLKNAFILTSKDRQINKIIDYTYSEHIFKKLKNKEGSIICQSNVGNLQSRLLKFDKAIYHLALSLQDIKLKRFLQRNLSDEFDEGDILLKIISNLFYKTINKEKNNRLVERQINNSKEEFSQKTIGILINTRYCRLIHAYFKFFQNMKKLNKINEKIIGEQFMNTTFHTLTYFHKILIQYIYLSYVKNDLVKIGESILDYIEFLIKFKFKVSIDDKYFMKIYNEDILEFQTKQDFKKKIFDKILKWFNLFDGFVSHVKDNSSLTDTKAFIDDYTKNIDSDNNNFNAEGQSALMFKVNIQRSEFLKGKFSLCCKNYNDALFYFIRAAKKKSIVIDGLIKKRSLKNLFKLLKRMKKDCEIFRIQNKSMEKELKEYQKNKSILYKTKINNSKKGSNRSKKENINDNFTFIEKIEEIKKEILQDINECNDMQERDILILIDFNVYNQKVSENLNIKTSKIDSFIEQTMIILNDYLYKCDRAAVFIYSDKYQIICPLMNLSNIDINNVSKDLYYYKNITSMEQTEEEYDDINIYEGIDNDIEFNIGNNDNINFSSQEDSLEFSENKEINQDKLSGFVESINYLNNYLIMKENIKNEKYLIVFTDMSNIQLKDEEVFDKVNKILENLNSNKSVIFLLVGKNKKLNFKNEKNISHEYFIKLSKTIMNKFNIKSKIIDFDNMKKIKSIISNNNVIKDEIIYPNEIYK